MPILKMMDLNLTNKRLLIREDFNVPIKSGKITSDARLCAALPTLEHAVRNKACTLLMSHLGRPTAGVYDPQFSLAPVAKWLTEKLQQPVRLISDWLNGVEVAAGEVVLCENVRFNEGEEENNEKLSQQLADLADIFVMDAFGTAHRAHASTCGVAKYVSIACAGPLLVAELEALAAVLKSPQRPVVAIVGGSKVSTKLNVLRTLLNKVDCLIVGGGIANTFLAAKGFAVGKSLYEPELIPTARELLAIADHQRVELPLPTDIVVAKEFNDQAFGTTKSLLEISADDMILDIGYKTATKMATILFQAKTILWNGPVGVFEFPAFAQGTKIIAQAIANSHSFSVAGGGDTLAAIDHYKLAGQIDYISTGGGAFLEFIEGKTLPAIAILEQRAQV